MNVSIFTDSAGRILAANPSDMSGNTGWIVVTEEALTAHTGVSVAELLDNASANGAALYVFRDGFAEHRTAEEIEADTPRDTQEKPSDTARIEALEAESIATMEAVAEVYEMMLGGM